MSFKKNIAELASRYSKSKVLRFFLRPFWKLYHSFENQRQLKNFHKNGLDLIRQVSETCNRNNILFWLDCGVLLGAYREGEFIHHDFDIDIGFMFEDRLKIQKLLRENGFRLMREFKIIKDGILTGLEQTYCYKSVLVDFLFYHRINDNQLKTNFFIPIHDDPSYKGFADIKEITLPYDGFDKFQFKDIPVYVPHNTSEYLMCYYGKEFMTPNPNYNYKEDEYVMNRVTFIDRKVQTAEYLVYDRLYL